MHGIKSLAQSIANEGAEPPKKLAYHQGSAEAEVEKLKAAITEKNN